MVDGGDVTVEPRPLIGHSLHYQPISRFLTSSLFLLSTFINYFVSIECRAPPFSLNYLVDFECDCYLNDFHWTGLDWTGLDFQLIFNAKMATQWRRDPKANSIKTSANTNNIEGETVK